MYSVQTAVDKPIYRQASTLSSHGLPEGGQLKLQLRVKVSTEQRGFVFERGLSLLEALVGSGVCVIR